MLEKLCRIGEVGFSYAENWLEPGIERCGQVAINQASSRFRVGNEERTWKMGEAWVFDDTIEHEAWNDADALRVIMILDVWNPYLNEEERDLVSTLMLARSEFYSGS